MDDIDATKLVQLQREMLKREQAGQQGAQPVGQPAQANAVRAAYTAQPRGRVYVAKMRVRGI
jgi:hypothetical protein